MDGADQVPDELVSQIAVDFLTNSPVAATGWMLDGFPRTKGQAEALLQVCLPRTEDLRKLQAENLLRCSEQAKLHPHVMVVIDVPNRLLVEKNTGRRIDPQTNTMCESTTACLAHAFLVYLESRTDSECHVHQKVWTEKAFRIISRKAFLLMYL